MPLIALKDISLAFGLQPLLERADFQLEAGERVGLIGRNGEGKSTFLNILAGEVQPDSGEIWKEPALKLTKLEQAPVLPEGATIYEAVADGLGEVGRLIARYHALSIRIATESELKELGELQHRLEAQDGWNLQQRVEAVLSRLDLPPDKAIESLSGGWQRRVSLARALVLDPDVLLLDEPTNHLDLEAIQWLEGQLQAFSGAVLFVTHDRAFLQKLATRIVDLDRGRLVSWPGDYHDYLNKKAAALEEEERRHSEFDKKLAQEEAWIRQGIKARRTRNEGRVRALKKMREARAQRRLAPGKAKLYLESGELSGKLVIEAENLTCGYGDQTVIRDFSTLILRGDRVGLIGPNGAGKTTLLQLLLKQRAPDCGTVRHGTRLKIAYFDQLRSQLDPDKTVAEAIGDGREYIILNGQRVHVMSYLSNFLFLPARARSPVRSLSGGEKNRALLAKLFSQPANLLVMDEPTNDLDMETLELLEELLGDFEGTLLMVSHDRTFLDNVVTSVLVFEGEGRIVEYVGGYSDWIRQGGKPAQSPSKPARSTVRRTGSNSKKKLSYKEQRELEQLPSLLEALESRQAELNERLSSGDFYQNDKAVITEALEELKTLEQKLEEAYTRWEELESLNDRAAQKEI